jgi:hypothetical protein
MFHVSLRKIEEKLGPGSGRLIAFFLATRAFLFAAGILAVLYLPKFASYYTSGQPLPIDIWWKWDAGWYMSIANDGYSFRPGYTTNVTWFPFYPLLIRLASFFVNPGIAAIIISHAALLAAIFLLYRLVNLDYSRKVSERTVLYMLLFPASLFFSAIYSESLFLALSVGSFYCARTGRWKLACILGFCAALTRSIGLALFPVLLLEYALQKKLLDGWRLRQGWQKLVDRKAAWLLLIPAGTLAFMAYLQAAFGNAFAFLESLAVVGRQASFPFSSFLEPFEKAGNIWFWLGVPFAAFGLAMLWLMRKELRPSYVLYALIMLILPLSSESLLGMHRYLLVIFPIFMMMAVLADEHKVHDYVVAISAVLLGTFMAMFANGGLIT